LGQTIGENMANLRQILERSVNQFRDWLAKTALPGSMLQGDLG
jgi:hypothetical protein